MTDANDLPAQYEQARLELLETIRDYLEGDPRFTAAWLTGSYGRNEADEFSDLDITVVVAEPHALELCSRESGGEPDAPPARRQVVTRFGEAALILDNHMDAPAGGASTFVLYAENAVAVDWVFVPQSAARRPQASVLLFDQATTPVEPPPTADPEELRRQVAHLIAYFWLMCVVTIKYILRGDAVKVNAFLDVLERTLQQVESVLQPGRRPEPKFSGLQVDPQQQIEAVRRACQRMQNLTPQAVQMGGKVPFKPSTAVDRLLEMAEDVTGRSPQ